MLNQQQWSWASVLPTRLLLSNLKSSLAARPEVDLVQLDTKWLTRLAAILEFAGRALWIATVLLVGAVVVIVGNTIRLDIQNRRQEIEVSKLLQSPVFCFCQNFDAH